MEDHCHPRVDEWAGYKRITCVTYGNDTTNRIEGLSGAYKRIINRSANLKKHRLFSAIPLNNKTGFDFISAEHFGLLEERFCNGSSEGRILSIFFESLPLFSILLHLTVHSLQCLE